ncbi:MAG: MFS transporter [Terriglobia bacterium]
MPTLIRTVTRPPILGFSRSKIPNLRWWILGLLFLVTMLNYVDRQTLSVLAPFLRDEFHMTNAEYAFVVNAFLVSYTLMQAVSGIMLDRLGTRWGFAVMFIWWSLASLLHRWARGVRSLALFRFMLGMGEAGNWPGAVKAIAEWFPSRERAVATGIFNAGACTGAVLAPPLIAFVTLHLHFGWRDTFFVISAGGLVWLVFWLALYYKPEQHPAIKSAEMQMLRNDPGYVLGTDAVKIPWAMLIGYREVWAVIIARFLTDPVWWFYVFWLPEYLKRERGFTLAMIGHLVWIPFLSSDLGCIVGGWFSDYLVRRNMSTDAARKIVLALSAVLTVDTLLVFNSEGATVPIILISVATFGIGSWGTLLLTIPTDLFPSNVVASVSGLSGFGAGVGGVMFMFLTGYLLDHFSYKSVLIIASLLHPVGFLTLVALLPKIRPVKHY